MIGMWPYLRSKQFCSSDKELVVATLPEQSIALLIQLFHKSQALSRYIKIHKLILRVDI